LVLLPATPLPLGQTVITVRAMLYETYQKSTLLNSINKSSAVCWDGRPFGHHSHGPKVAGVAAVPLSVGGAGSHLTQYGLGRGLPPYQVASSIFIHPSSDRLATVHQRYRQTTLR